MRRHNVLICMVVLVVSLLLLGCSSDTQVLEPESPAPLDLPSVSTMEMDVDFFKPAQIDTQSAKLGKFDESIAASPAALKLNYLNAAVRVFFLNVVAYSVLAEPVAAFATAIHSVPQHQEDGSWLWTYIYVDNQGSEYSIFLRGKRMDTHVEWKMEVSSNDPNMILDHFLWFSGEVAIDRDSGYWQFYEPATSGIADSDTPGIPSVRIDWLNNGVYDTRLAFLINKAGDEAEGTTLIFEEELETAMIEFYDATNDSTGTIIWHRDGSGSIEWPDYKEGVKGCWDVSQFDIDCL